jgi:hypothetical protein
MSRSQVADGGNGLQPWRVAAIIWNKQLRTADKRWSSSLMVGVGLRNPHQNKEMLYRHCFSTLSLGRARKARWD